MFLGCQIVLLFPQNVFLKKGGFNNNVGDQFGPSNEVPESLGGPVLQFLPVHISIGQTPKAGH